MGDFNDAIEKALKSPQDMDAYLEVRSAQEVIDDILALTRPEPDARERHKLELTINRALLDDEYFGNRSADEDQLEAQASGSAVMIADAILSAGLVPDEAKIRADEREKCAEEANGVDPKFLEGKSELHVSIYCSARVDAAAAIRNGGQK